MYLYLYTWNNQRILRKKESLYNDNKEGKIFRNKLKKKYT